MGERKYTDAHDWALFVSEDEPHGLEELQHRLKVSVPTIIERAARSPGQKVLHVLYVLLSVCALVGPVLSVTVFFNRSEAVTRQYDFDAGFELTVALLGFACGAFFEGRLIYRWRNEGGYRDSAAIFLSAFVLVCALGTILQAYLVTGSAPILVTVCLIPAFVTAMASIVGIVLPAIAPPKPQEAEPDRDPPEAEYDLTKISGDARAAVLKNRNKALSALDARHLLKGYELDELQARPLGKLTERAQAEGSGESR